MQKNVKSKIIKIRTGCQYVRYFFFYYSEHLYWAAQKLRLGRGLDIAGLGLEKENQLTSKTKSNCRLLWTI